MNKREKIMLVIIIILSILLILVTGAFFIKNIIFSNDNYDEEIVKRLEGGIRLNISSKLMETKFVEGLEVKNIKLTYNEELKISELTADVENKTGVPTESMQIKVILYNKNGKEINTIYGQINALKSGEKTQINMGILDDCSNAYDFTIERYQEVEENIEEVIEE